MGFASHLNIALAGVRWHYSGRRKRGTKLLFPGEVYAFCSVCLHQSARKQGSLPLLGLVEILIPRASSGTLILPGKHIECAPCCRHVRGSSSGLQWCMVGNEGTYYHPEGMSPGSLLIALWHCFSKQHVVPFLVQTPKFILKQCWGTKSQLFLLCLAWIGQLWYC